MNLTTNKDRDVVETRTKGCSTQEKERTADDGRTADVLVPEEFTFNKFMLCDSLLKALGRLNFVKPSPIQLKVIPLAKSGFDMILQAKSGTGKTLAFSICLLENYDSELKFPQALVIVPTREVAVQVAGVLNELGRSMKNFKAEYFIGGNEITTDRKKIQVAKAVVGTPGRIHHLIKNEVFNITYLKTLVLDEADKLLESGRMGKDVLSVIKQLHKKVQIIAATATTTSKMENVIRPFMKNPIGVTPKLEVPVLLGIKQFVLVLSTETDNIQLMKSKIDELLKIFTRITFKQCLLFTDSQSKTNSYGNYLNKVGWKNEVINGAQEQSQRLSVLNKLINFQCRVLITTDLMARGIDIENINLIINLDLPYDCVTYLHRIGRAGRFGSHGIAITFVNGEEELKKFQEMLGDVGGNCLNVMKYPEDSELFDFWNFHDKKILNTAIEESMNETLLENLTLLEITSKLVDKERIPLDDQQNFFKFNSMIEDYEHSLNETEKGVKENFKQAIEDSQLYGSENELEQTETARRIESETLPKSSSSEYLSSEHSDSRNPRDQMENPASTSSYGRSKPAATYSFNPYFHSVSANYSQWQNMFKYQLTNIQNYVERKPSFKS